VKILGASSSLTSKKKFGPNKTRHIDNPRAYPQPPGAVRHCA